MLTTDIGLLKLTLSNLSGRLESRRGVANPVFLLLVIIFDVFNLCTALLFLLDMHLHPFQPLDLNIDPLTAISRRSKGESVLFFVLLTEKSEIVFLGVSGNGGFGRGDG